MFIPVFLRATLDVVKYEFCVKIEKGVILVERISVEDKNIDLGPLVAVGGPNNSTG